LILECRLCGASLYSPFSNFHFGVRQTGSTVDRDWLAERPWDVDRR